MQLTFSLAGQTLVRQLAGLSPGLIRRLTGVLALLVFVLGSYSVAQAGQTTSPQTTSVVFVNGVLTTLTDALSSGIKLCEAYSAKEVAKSSSVSLTCQTVYNRTDGKIGDLLESALLSVQSNYSTFFSILLRLAPMPPAFQTAYNDIVRADAVPDVTGGDLTKLQAVIHGLTTAGNLVLVVPHSEGNFLADLAYKNLSACDATQTGVVNVASPDDHVANSLGLYTTFNSDLVIQVATLARGLAALSTLPGNVDLAGTGSFRDSFHHAFVQAYLANASEKITGDMDAVAATLSQCVIPTQLTLAANPTSLPSTGGSVILTATISAAPTTVTAAAQSAPTGIPSPTGTVSFVDQNGVTFCSDVSLSSDSAICSASISTPPDTVTATYSGDTEYAASSGTTTVSVASQTASCGAGSKPSFLSMYTTSAEGGGTLIYGVFCGTSYESPGSQCDTFIITGPNGYTDGGCGASPWQVYTPVAGAGGTQIYPLGGVSAGGSGSLIVTVSFSADCSIAVAGPNPSCSTTLSASF